MKKWIFCLIAAAGFSALPPLAQSIKEMQAILADSRLYHSLGSPEMIQEFVRTEEGYLITTQHYTLQVNVKYLRGQHRIGPVQFELEFDEPIPRTYLNQ